MVGHVTGLVGRCRPSWRRSQPRGRGRRRVSNPDECSRRRAKWVLPVRQRSRSRVARFARNGTSLNPFPLWRNGLHGRSLNLASDRARSAFQRRNQCFEINTSSVDWRDSPSWSASAFRSADHRTAAVIQRGRHRETTNLATAVTVSLPAGAACHCGVPASGLVVVDLSEPGRSHAWNTPPVPFASTEVVRKTREVLEPPI